MKNRRFLGFVTVLLLIACLTATAFASPTDHVTDGAGLFTDAQRQALEQRAAAISAEYDFGVYIVTLEDFKDYTSSSNIEKFAVRYYDDNEFGFGDDRAGTMLMLSMAERDYDLDFNSKRADTIFTEAGRDWMENRFLLHFRGNDFYSGFNEYLNTCEEYLEAARNGEPVGQGMPSSADEEKPSPAIALIPGAIAALLVGILTSAPMHSAGIKRDADQYMVRGSLNLRRRSDMFLHRSVSRRLRQTQSSGSHRSHSSGGSHHYSSGSHSGRSGKF